MAHLTRGMTIVAWLLIGSHAGLDAGHSVRERLQREVQTEIPTENVLRREVERRRARETGQVLPSLRESRRLGSEPMKLDASAGIRL